MNKPIQKNKIIQMQQFKTEKGSGFRLTLSPRRIKEKKWMAVTCTELVFILLPKCLRT